MSKFMRVYNLSLYFLIFTFIVVTHSFAQPRGEGNQTGIMIVSEPSGAYVTLDGEYNFTGRTPFLYPTICWESIKFVRRNRAIKLAEE